MIKNFLKPEGHQNPINGSKVRAILLKGWILLISGASAVEGLQSTGLPRLVFYIARLVSAIGFKLPMKLIRPVKLQSPKSFFLI